MAGIHGCSLHHSQSQEEGEGKEREGGGEDGSGKNSSPQLLPQNDLSRVFVGVNKLSLR